MSIDTLHNPKSAIAIEELKNVMTGSKQWVKIHSAEYLLWLGYCQDEVRKEFLKEEEKSRTVKNYRIGVWRVLAQSEKTEERRKKWVSKIFEAFSSDSSERLHAIEALAKLKICPSRKYPDQTGNALQSGVGHLNLFTLWATSYCSEQELKSNQEKFLELAISHTDVNVKVISCYALRKLGGLQPELQRKLYENAFAEPEESSVKYNLLHTAYVLTDDEKMLHVLRRELLKGYEHFTADKRTELALALSEKARVEDIPFLESLVTDNKAIGDPSKYNLNDQDAELRAAIAFAILKIKLS